MTGIRKARLFAPFPNTYVKSVLKKVGVVKRCFGYWPHELQVGKWLAEWVNQRSSCHWVGGWVVTVGRVDG